MHGFDATAPRLKSVGISTLPPLDSRCSLAVMKRKVLKPIRRPVDPGKIISVATRRRMESDLREEEERIALSALDSLSAHIAILDGAGTIVAVNQAWREFAREKS